MHVSEAACPKHSVQNCDGSLLAPCSRHAGTRELLIRVCLRKRVPGCMEVLVVMIEREVLHGVVAVSRSRGIGWLTLPGSSFLQQLLQVWRCEGSSSIHKRCAALPLQEHQAHHVSPQEAAMSVLSMRFGSTTSALAEHVLKS